MRRREFIGLLGGAAATWPLSAGAQTPARLGYLGAGTAKPEHLELLRRLRAAFDNIYSECQDYHGPIATSADDAERIIKAVRVQCEEAFALPNDEQGRFKINL